MPRKAKVVETVCAYCHVALDRQEVYCSRCGTKVGEDVPDIRTSTEPPFIPMYNSTNTCPECHTDRTYWKEEFCVCCGYDFTTPPAPFMTKEAPVGSFDLSKERGYIKPMPFQTITGTIGIPSFTQNEYFLTKSETDLLEAARNILVGWC